MLASSIPCPVFTSPLPHEVEVFKTNVASAAQGGALLHALHARFPGLQATLDLDDCDRVLRVQGRRAGPALWQRVMELVRGLGVRIEVLPD